MYAHVHPLTIPRCLIVGCCSEYPFCHRSSTEELVAPPAGGATAADTLGHPRFRGRQTREALEETLRLTLKEALELNRQEARDAAGADYEEMPIAV